jgi:hypothetical protein
MLQAHPRSTRLRQLAAPALVLAVAGSAGLAAAGSLAGGLVVPSAYFASIVAAGLAAAGRERDAALLLTPAALAVLHFAWGIGFLVGRPSRTGQRAAAS